MPSPYELNVAYNLPLLCYKPCPAIDTGVAVLCSPGGMASRAYFEIGGTRSLAERLSSAGVTCYLIDTLGTGRSRPEQPGDDVTRDAAADALAATAAAVRPQHRELAGLGHSLGAWLTVTAQRRANCFDSLALLGYAPGWRALSDLARAPIVQERRRAWLLDRQQRSDPLRWSHDSVSFPTPLSANHERIVTPVPRALALDFGADQDALVDCARIDVPVYLGFGGLDVSTPDDECTHYPMAPSVTTYVLPNAGHTHVLAEDAELMWDNVAGWLTRRTLQRKDGDLC